MIKVQRQADAAALEAELEIGRDSDEAAVKAATEAAAAATEASAAATAAVLDNSVAISHLVECMEEMHKDKGQVYRVEVVARDANGRIKSLTITPVE